MNLRTLLKLFPQTSARATRVGYLGLVVLAACTTVDGRPARTLDPATLIAAFESDKNGGARLATLVDQYYKDGTTSEQRKQIRNQIIDVSLVLMNLHFSQFVDRFSGGKKLFDSGTDILTIATDATSSLMTPASTKSILAAVAGGITASKVSINKNVFYDQTVHLLIKQMDAQRQVVAADLLKGSAQPESAYPLSAALMDLERYYMAGTFDGAMTAIQQSAAEEQTKAEKEIKDERERIAAVRAGTETALLKVAKDVPVARRAAKQWYLAILADSILRPRALGKMQAIVSLQQRDPARARTDTVVVPLREALDRALGAPSDDALFKAANLLTFFDTFADEHALAEFIGSFPDAGIL